MSVQSLKHALAQSTSPPPSVVVGVNLWKQLRDSGEVETGKFCPVGKPDLIFELPVIKGTVIFISVDPVLQMNAFFIP